ncbi:MAG: ATP-dependent sacrificial sulfur transferase LarE [bacterium]
MTPERESKLDRLKGILRGTGGCAVAYSGGVDSSLVLAVAREVLGERCLAVIALSPTYAQRECQAAVQWVESQGIPHAVVESDELDVPGFRENPPDRCYHCKAELFARVREEAKRRDLPHIGDGTNADDAHDHRPGLRAAREAGVLSPLMEAGMTKADIRAIAREVYGLPVADKPAMACMASRFPYGSEITEEKLSQVEAVESFLEANGLRVYRARHHGRLLRLELGPQEMVRFRDPQLRSTFVRLAKQRGFTYVTLDLEGYRPGSMNETLGDT